MTKISTADARGRYTKMLIAVYSQRKAPTSFFRSFFQVQEADTLELSIEVQRGSEMIAVDVERGTEGNRNTFNKSTEKIFIPPYFKEFFDITDMDLYDRLFIDSEVDSRVVAKFIRKAAQKLRLLQDKIERATEKMCADVLEFGIVQVNTGDNINYGRQAASLVDSGSSQYWADNIDPYAQIETDIEFIRTEGLTESSVYNLILGKTALSDLLKNTKFQDRQKLFQIKLDDVTGPIAQAVGGTLHGEISAGSYKVRLWTYTGQYKSRAGVTTPYMNPKKYILLPEVTEFTLGYGAVPQLINEDGQDMIVPRQGAFVVGDFIDKRATTHVYEMKSAPLPIPVVIDTCVTRQVCA